MQVGSGTRDVDVEHIVGDVEDHKLREDLRSCQHFLVDSTLERARHKVFNYAVETLNETVVNGKLDQFFNNLNCAAKVNLAFVFILKNIEDGIQILLRTRKQYPAGSVQTCVLPWRLGEVERFFQQNWRHRVLQPRKNEHKVEVLQVNKLHRICCLTQRRAYGVQERSLTRTPAQKSHKKLSHVWRKHKTTILRQPVCFSALALLALHLHGNQRLEEETSKLFNLFTNEMDGLSPNQFQGVHMNDIPTVEDLLTLNILSYDIDIVDGNIVGELARRSVQ